MKTGHRRRKPRNRPKPAAELITTRRQTNFSAAAAFADRVELGDYRKLYATSVMRILEQAAAHVAEDGLIDEQGALRLVLARLLAEPDQPVGELATHVTRVALAAVRVARAQKELTPIVAEQLGAALGEIAQELDAARTETAARATAQPTAQENRS